MWVFIVFLSGHVWWGSRIIKGQQEEPEYDPEDHLTTPPVGAEPCLRPQDDPPAGDRNLPLS